MIFARKELPPSLHAAYDAFLAVLEPLEPAKAGLSDVLPGTRMPGRPLTDAVAAYERGLVDAAAHMAAWRRAEVEAEWVACRDGLEEALGRTRRLRAEAPDLTGFESLLGLVESLLDPLDPFVDAEARFRALRRRGAAHG